MPVPFVACRNRVTAAEAEIPETALPHLTNWEPLDQPPAGGGVAVAASAQIGAPYSWDGGPANEPDPAPAGEQPAPRATKSRKAAQPAATEKE